MQIVPIDDTPNQEFSIVLDNVRYDMRLRALTDVMCVDLTIDDVVTLTGVRVVDGTGIIPYKYLEMGGGNFFFLTELGDIPYWTEFGTTQDLVFINEEELAEIRGN